MGDDLDCSDGKLQTAASKFLGYVFRREPEAIRLLLDKEGWADVNALIAAAARHWRELNRALIERLAVTNKKKRHASKLTWASS